MDSSALLLDQKDPLLNSSSNNNNNNDSSNEMDMDERNSASWSSGANGSKASATSTTNGGDFKSSFPNRRSSTSSIRDHVSRYLNSAETWYHFKYKVCNTRVGSCALTFCSNMNRSWTKPLVLVLLLVFVIVSVSSLFDSSEYASKLQRVKEWAHFQEHVRDRAAGRYNVDVVPPALSRELQPPRISVEEEAPAVKFQARKKYNRNLPWTYTCVDSKCVRQRADGSRAKVSLDVCWLTCGDTGALWPKPAEVRLSKTTGAFLMENFFVRDIQGPTDLVRSVLSVASNYTRHRLRNSADADYAKKGNLFKSGEEEDQQQVPKYHSPENTMVEVHLVVDEESMTLAENTDESYQLTIKSVTMGTGALVTVTIRGHTYFGVRHGLETLSQLITFDEFNSCFQIVDDVTIKDGPAYTFRGIMIDTARNFMPVDEIYRVLDAMSFNKLNFLHWHITDSNSFPFDSRRVPQMTKYGVYDVKEIYSIEDIQNIVSYATIRGIQVVPELDSPAHAGNGWQWGPEEGMGDLAVCIGQEPWRQYCGQPPCGQLNPMNAEVFGVLSKLYEDFLEAFTPTLFHMGGDEVYPKCWSDIPGMSEWMKSMKFQDHREMWGYFQQIAHQKLVEANQGQAMRAIIWTSGLTGTKAGDQYLEPENFIVQIWEPSNNAQIGTILKSGYKVIFSNVDAMYLDFDGSTWLGTEHAYSYLSWQKLYDNNLDNIVTRAAASAGSSKEVNKFKSQVLGGVAPLWSEKVNDVTLQMKLWPRATALAERLWSNPGGSRTGVVYARLNQWNQRLKERGVQTSVLQPESCLQMSGNCDDPDHRL